MLRAHAGDDDSTLLDLLLRLQLKIVGVRRQQEAACDCLRQPFFQVRLITEIQPEPAFRQPQTDR